VLKTKWRRNLHTLEMGKFHAHITQLWCKSCRVNYSNEELSEIVQAHCRFGFDVLVYVGQCLFVECINEAEIKRRLTEKNIFISQRGIGKLGKKFVILLSLTALKTMFLRIEEKVEVFDQLREAMRIALPQTTKGLNDPGEGDLCTIRNAFSMFMPTS